VGNLLGQSVSRDICYGHASDARRVDVGAPRISSEQPLNYRSIPGEPTVGRSDQRGACVAARRVIASTLSHIPEVALEQLTMTS
jgi:hypothetical protein